MTDERQDSGAAVHRRWGPRAVTLGDQVLSSVSNMLAVVLVARAVSAEEFGTFALGYSVLTLVLGLTRGYFGTRVSLEHDDARARVLTRQLIGSVLLISPIVIAVVFVLSHVMSGGDPGGILVIVALATPIVCMQDVGRFGAVAAGKPWAAAVSDGLWVVLMLVPFALGTRVQAKVVLWLWFAAALAALVTIMICLRVGPDLRGGLEQLRTRHAVGEATTWGTVISTSATLWILFVASAAISPVASGSLRGASTAMGPVNVLIAFIGLGLTPMLVRRPRSQDVSFCLRAGAGLAVVAALWGGVLLVLPTWLGEAFFGQSWTGIRSVLPVTTVEYVLLCLSAVTTLGLRVNHLSRDLLTQRIITGTVTVVLGGVVAFATRSTIGIAMATATAAGVAAVIGWTLFTRHRSETAGYPAGVTGGDPSDV
jgi:O-antigen/teichoic acid export membrane protein